MTHIKLQDLILGSNLDEGLIKTYPIDDSINILNRDKTFAEKFKASKIQSWLVVEFQHDSMEWKSLEDAHIAEDMMGIGKGEPDIQYLLRKLNSLGYAPAFYLVLRFGTQIEQHRFSYNKLREAISTGKGTSYQILFQAKYSEVVSTEDVPLEIYHISDSKNDDKIKKIGIVPKKSERYDDRIYVVFHTEDINKNLVDNLKRQKNCESLTVYSIDTTNSGLVLYRDPEYLDRGFYIKRNVPPNKLSVLKHI